MIISRRVSRPAGVAACLGLAVLLPSAMLAAPASAAYNVPSNNSSTGDKAGKVIGGVVVLGLSGWLLGMQSRGPVAAGPGAAPGGVVRMALPTTTTINP